MARNALAALALAALALAAFPYLGTLLPAVEMAEAVKPVVAAVKPSESPITLDGGRVVQIWTRSSLGHACPVSTTEAYTADHVAVYHADGDPTQGKGVPVMWGDRYGNSGTAIWMWSDIRRDLSLIRSLDAPFSGWFRIAVALPKVGETVVIVGYDYEAGMVDKSMRAKILMVRAGLLTYDKTPGPGSSGSCVLSEAGEIVGINVAAINGQGIGVLVSGGWDKVPDAYLQGSR